MIKFDLISSNLKKIEAFLDTTKEFTGEEWTRLYHDLHQLENLSSDANEDDIGKYLFLLVENLEKNTTEIYLESVAPTLVELTVGNEIQKVRTLALVPRTVLVLAGKLLEKSQDPIQTTFLRRLINISANGGIPIQYLNLIKNFKLKPANFDSCALPICLPPDYQINDLDNVSESKLRVLLWDNLINSLIGEGKDEPLPLDLAPEVEVKTMLGLEVDRRIDLGILSLKFDLPIVIIEYARDDMEGSFGHKDFVKLTSLMTISCVRLSQKLQGVGSDPQDARIFGLLVGGTQIQMLVAHPTIVDNPDEESSGIHVSISIHEHWYMNILKRKTGQSFNCDNLKCCKSDLHFTTINQSSVSFPSVNDFDELRIPKKIKLDDEREEADYEEISDVKSINRPEFIELNIETVKKIDSFLKCAKEIIKKLDSVDLNGDPGKYKKIFPPNISNAPPSLRSHFGITPERDQIKKVTNNRNLEGIRKSLAENGSYFKKKGKLNFEYQLYTKYFRNSSIFPQLISSQVDYETKIVEYKFETMQEFLGEGGFGLISDYGKTFGPLIRDTRPGLLLIEAATFAVHILYALHVLHEEFEVVHGDISPKNVMFSVIDDVWKLNDFVTCLPIEESLKTPRKIGTPEYICPESEETGLFGKSSDIYSLGKVLWWTFVMKLICQVEVDGCSVQEEKDLNQFMKLVRQLTHPIPSERPNAKTALRCFYEFMCKIMILGFETYGSDLMIPRIEALLCKDETDTEDFK